MPNEFWRSKSLSAMTDEEWELLCDGCARCCMIKLQDEDSERVHYTAVVCGLLDTDNCKCTRYPLRHRLVPDCVVLTPERAVQFQWLPATCAYRTLAEGRELPYWHPLISGSKDSVHEAQISVRGKVVSETDVHVDEHQSMLVSWVEQ